MKNSLFKLLSIFASSVVCLLIIEAFLYYENYRPNYKKFQFKLTNNYILTNNSVNDLEKKNIFFLGDSFTHSEVCSGNKKDFVNLLNLKTDYQILNYGFNGGNPIQYIDFLKQVEKNLINTKSVIIVLYFNDIALTNKTCFYYKKYKDELFFYPKKCDFILKSKIDSENDSILKKIDNFLENKLNIWLVIKEALANFPLLNKFYHRSSWEGYFTDETSDEFKSMVYDLKYIQTFLNKKKINLLITYFPDVNFLKKEQPRALIWSKFIKKSKKYDLSIIDPWDFFLKNTIKDDLTWSLVDKHANCEANEIMSKFLINKLN